MAHKKGAGSTRNGRDSNPQYRGIKLYGGEEAKPGSIIVRQRGTQYHPGKNVGIAIVNAFIIAGTKIQNLFIGFINTVLSAYNAIADSVMRKASAPNSSTSSSGSMTLPFDFDIFWPFSSRTRA